MKENDYVNLIWVEDRESEIHRGTAGHQAMLVSASRRILKPRALTQARQQDTGAKDTSMSSASDLPEKFKQAKTAVVEV